MSGKQILLSFPIWFGALLFAIGLLSMLFGFLFIREGYRQSETLDINRQEIPTASTTKEIEAVAP